MQSVLVFQYFFLLFIMYWNLSLPQVCFTISIWNRDAALYALGVGACSRNALDDKELKYVYHEDGQKFIQVLQIGSAVVYTD